MEVWKPIIATNFATINGNALSTCCHKSEAKKGRPAHNNRNIVNALLWINRSGAPWRDLPATYGSWKSVHTRFKRWRELGIFERILKKLANESDEESRMIDATYVRVHQHAAGAKGGASSRRSDGSRGGLTTKTHAIIDALGNPLRFRLTPGNSADCTVGYEMLESMDLHGRLVIADRGYETDRILHLLDNQQATAVIPSQLHRRVQRQTDW